jgi:hypothetical protein
MRDAAMLPPTPGEEAGADSGIIPAASRVAARVRDVASVGPSITEDTEEVPPIPLTKVSELIAASCAVMLSGLFNLYQRVGELPQVQRAAHVVQEAGTGVAGRSANVVSSTAAQLSDTAAPALNRIAGMVSPLAERVGFHVPRIRERGMSAEEAARLSAHREIPLYRTEKELDERPGLNISACCALVRLPDV